MKVCLGEGNCGTPYEEMYPITRTNDFIQLYCIPYITEDNFINNAMKIRMHMSVIHKYA